jgi:hypothetical protein
MTGKVRIELGFGLICFELGFGISQPTVKDLQAKLDEEIKERLAVKFELDKINAMRVFGKLADGLSDGEIEKFKLLAEDLDFDVTLPTWRRS